MTDFKLDPITRDLVVEGGMELVRDGDEAAQRVSLAVGLNLGEWFLNINLGLPWIKNNTEGLPESIQYMLGNRRSDISTFIDNTITDYLKSQDFIRSVTYTSNYSTQERLYQYTANIITEEGEEITLIPFQTQI
jgi:hypothetical protein